MTRGYRFVRASRLALLSLTWLAAAGCARPAWRPPHIGPEELARERTRIAEVRRALEVRPFTLEAFQRALGSSPTSTRGLGFGAQLVEYSWPLVASSLRIAIHAPTSHPPIESPIARLEVAQCIPDPRHWDELAREWGGEARLEPPRLWLERGDAWLEGELRTRILDELGYEAEAAPGADLALAWDTLNDPLIPLAIGAPHCHYVGVVPRGCAETAALVGAERFDLLRAALRSPNPEARLYAAHALLAHGTPEPADTAAIERLARLATALRIDTLAFHGERGWSAALETLAEDCVCSVAEYQTWGRKRPRR